MANHPSSGDLFLRIIDTVYTPFIGHSEGDDLVVVHGHPLNGTKFFTWGNSGPGRFMQDFISGGQYRTGDYTELQVGPAPTQMQTFQLKKNSKLEWTEWFIGITSDANVLNGANYKAAISNIEILIKSNIPTETVEYFDTFLKKYASVVPQQVLYNGNPWGALEEMKNKKSLAAGLSFSIPDDIDDPKFKDAVPWVELLTTGRFSADTLSSLPTSYQTTDSWRDLILRSSQVVEMTWLHALHLGVCSTERGLVDEPKQYFNMYYVHNYIIL